MAARSWRNIGVLQALAPVRLLASLKTAVATMGALGAILAVGTIVESRYGPEMARICVYGQWWFRLVLVFLFLNIFLSVFVRLPLQRRQYPFACIHLGMLLVLLGSAATWLLGFDGTMAIREGAATRAVLLPETVVRTYLDERLLAERPMHRTFLRRQGDLGAVPGLGLRAPRIVELIPFSRTLRNVAPDSQGTPVVELSVLGAGADTALHMGLGSRFAPSRANAGQLAFVLEMASSASSFLDTSARVPPRLEIGARAGEDSIRLQLPDLRPGKVYRAGSLSVEIQEFLTDATIGPWGLANRSDSLVNPAVRLHVVHQDSSWNEILYGRASDFRFSGNRHPDVVWSVEFHPAGAASKKPLLRLGVSGDRILARFENNGRILSSFPVAKGRDMPLPIAGRRVRLRAFERRGVLRDSCVAADPAPGRGLPPPAIRVEAGPWGRGGWLSLGSVLFWNEGGSRRALSFEPRRIALPFGIRLDRFRMETDPGTSQAASYESDVHVVDSSGRPLDSARIAMNEPLKRGGIVLCQSGFAAEPGEVPTTFLSVDRDPGRWLKYIGALVAMLSIVWYFLERNRPDRKDDLP